MTILNKPAAASEPGGSSAITYPYPVVGVVKDNIDPFRQGAIRVWIESSENVNTNPEDDKCWVTCYFLSPFFGATLATSGEDTYGSYKTNPSSYGMWYSPPDLGSRVLCIFVQGKPSQGYWIGGIPNPLLLHMVPAIGGREDVVPNKGEAASMADAVRLPAAGLNTNNPAISTGVSYLEEPTPVHSYTAAILQQQGLIRDAILGVIGSSATRESPSRVGWGVSTPGRPIYAGGFDDTNLPKALDEGIDQSQLKVIGRRGGHSIVMDDGDILGRDQLIRVRTAGGHQIMMHDKNQILSILHSNGQSYIEFGKEGTIDMYSTNSINMRSQGDINIHADRDVNINGNKNTKINTNGDLELTSAKKTKHLAGSTYELSSGMIMTIKGGLGLAIESGGIASFSGSLLTFIKGKVVLINTLTSPLIAKDVKGSDIVTNIDNIWTPDQGFVSVPNAMASICSRVPAHYPWDDSNKGVDLKVDLSKSSALPDAPNEQVAKINKEVAQLEGQIASGIMSNSPSLSGVSKNLDSFNAGAMLAAQSQVNANSPFASSNKNGYAIVDVNGKKEIRVGPAGMPISQLESGGILKPGAATLIENNINKGMPPEQAFATNLFTGKAGAKNFQELIASYTSQAGAANSSYQRAQTELIQAGVITGTAAPNQEAGVTLAAATNGTAAVARRVAQSTGSSTAATIARKTDKIAQTVNLGNQAVNAVNSSDKPISAAIQFMERNPKFAGKIDYNKGTTGAALSVVKEGIGKLEAGQPVNLGALAAAKGIERFTNFSIKGSKQGGLAGYVSNQFINAANTYTSTFTNQLKANFKNNIAGTVAINNSFAQAGLASQTKLLGLQNTALGAAQGIKAAGLFLNAGQFSLASNALASGLGSIPGIGGYVTTINNAVQTISTAIKVLPGQIRDTFTAITNATKAVSFANKTSQLTGVTVGLSKSGQAAQQIFGGPAGGGIAGIFSSAKAGFDSIVQAGSAALGTAFNVMNAVASVAALFGGKRKIRKGVSKNKTVNRAGINKQILSTIGDPKIPAPIFIEGVSELQIQELNKIREKARQQVLNRGVNANNRNNPANQGVSGIPKNIINDATTDGQTVNQVAQGIVTTNTGATTVIGAGLSTRVLQANEAQALSTEVRNLALAKKDYDYIASNYPQGSPEILAAKNKVDSLTAQNQISSTALSTQLPITPTNPTQYNINQIPQQYRAFYLKFRRLPPGARVLPDGTII